MFILKKFPLEIVDLHCNIGIKKYILLGSNLCIIPFSGVFIFVTLSSSALRLLSLPRFHSGLVEGETNVNVSKRCVYDLFCARVMNLQTRDSTFPHDS